MIGPGSDKKKDISYFQKTQEVITKEVWLRIDAYLRCCFGKDWGEQWGHSRESRKVNQPTEKLIVMWQIIILGLNKKDGRGQQTAKLAVTSLTLVLKRTNPQKKIDKIVQIKKGSSNQRLDWRWLDWHQFYWLAPTDGPAKSRWNKIVSSLMKTRSFKKKVQIEEKLSDKKRGIGRQGPRVALDQPSDTGWWFSAF